MAKMGAVCFDHYSGSHCWRYSWRSWHIHPYRIFLCAHLGRDRSGSILDLAEYLANFVRPIPFKKRLRTSFLMVLDVETLFDISCK